MIVELLLDFVLGSLGRGLVLAVWPRRRAPPARAAPPQVVVSSGAMFDRLALYEAWAAAHGLERTSLRGAELAGSYRGRSTEMVTGLLDAPLPRSPKILIRIALPAIALATLATRLDIEGVHNVGVTRDLVRIRFDPFVTTSVFDAALEALEHALAACDAGEARPYR